MELNDEEEAALIAALENRGLGNPIIGQRLLALGLIRAVDLLEVEFRDALTPAGQLVATVLKKESRLERAKAKLREWKSTVENATTENQFAPDASISWNVGFGWCAELTWPSHSLQFGDRAVSTCGSESDDPLTAVIEASKRTPWQVEE